MSKARHGNDHRVRRARYQLALDRPELRQPSEPRQPPAGATSFPIKAEDPETRRLIDEALARRKR